MVRDCHAPRLPLQNYFSGHFEWGGGERAGGGGKQWLAEQILDRQRQTMDIPAHAKTAHDGLPRKRLKEDLC